MRQNRQSVHRLALASSRYPVKLVASGESLADVQQGQFTLDSLVAQYLRAVRLTTTPKTRDLYQLTLEGTRGFLDYCHQAGISHPDQLRTRHLQDWVSEHMESGHWQAVTAEGRLRNLSFFLHWLEREGEIEKVPQIPKVTVPQKALQVLDRGQMQQLVSGGASERDQLILTILTQTGVRASELCQVELADVFRQGDRFFMQVHGKGHKTRLVPIAPALFRRLSKWIKEGRPESSFPHLFLSERVDFKRQDYAPLTRSGLRQIVMKAAKSAGITQNVYTHLLRHSFATEALRRGADGHTLTDVLGHSTDRMLRQHYAHLTAEDSYDKLMAVLAPDQLPNRRHAA